MNSTLNQAAAIKELNQDNKMRTAWQATAIGAVSTTPS